MRIQVLELPSRVTGEVVEPQFAIVIDEADATFVGEGAQAAAVALGAVGALIFDQRVEVV